MNIKKTRFFLIFAFASLSLLAQTNTKPSNYNEAIQQGDDAFRRAEYTTAIEKYRIAETFDQEQWKTVQEKIEKVYKAINTEIKECNALKEEKLVIEKITNDSLKEKKTVTVKNTKQKPIKWNEFFRLYNERSDQWFVNIGYGINIINNVTYSANKDSSRVVGNSIGLNFGGRHGIYKKMGIGYQVGIGLGFDVCNDTISPLPDLIINKKGTYLHLSLGVKFYPWNCFFISANYGVVGMKDYEIIKSPNSINEQFAYYEEVGTKLYHGFSLMGGADICFGKRTTDKFGGIINIAVGFVYAEKRPGIALNLGMGFVFRK